MAKAMQPQKLHFSQAMQTEKYKNLINNTLGDPVRAARFAANITSAVAVNPTLQECDAGTILAGALLGESLLLQPSPQLGQFYLVPFKSKAKRDRQGNVIEPAIRFGLQGIHPVGSENGPVQAPECPGNQIRGTGRLGSL
jgi:recombination protein RecT